MAFRKNFIFQVLDNSLPPIPPKGALYYVVFGDDPKLYAIDGYGVVKPAFDTNTGSTISTNVLWENYNVEAVAGEFATYEGIPAGCSTSVTITADNIGVGGNSILIDNYPGTVTIASGVTIWNTAHPTNTATLTSGDGTQIPDNKTKLQFSGGIDAVAASPSTGVQVIEGGSKAIGDYSLASGENNSASGTSSAIVGGKDNSIEPLNFYSGIFVGKDNTITNAGGAYHNAIVGGNDNLIASPANRSGIIAGNSNEVNAELAVIIGGFASTLNGSNSVILGGTDNNVTVTATKSIILGGESNEIAATSSAIVGGYDNTNTGSYSTILAGYGCNIQGGVTNFVAGKSNTIGNVVGGFGIGKYTEVYGDYSFAGGVADNPDCKINVSGECSFAFTHTLSQFSSIGVSGNYSALLGGTNSAISGENAAILGGESNRVSGNQSGIIGGESNRVPGNHSAIIGGENNVVFSVGSTIGNSSAIIGGNYNQVSGSSSTIICGEYNNITSAATKSAIIGGSGQTLTTASTVMMPKIELSEDGAGIIMISSGGTKYNLTVDDSGNLVTTAV